MSTKNHSLSRKAKKTITTVIIIISLILLLVIAYTVGVPLCRFAGDAEQFRDWVQQKGIWSRVFFVAMLLFQIFLAVIPGEPFEIAAGYAFGAVEGTILCVIGTAIGSVLVFLFVRKFGIRILEIYFPKEKIESLKFLQNSKKLFYISFLIMLIPGTPKDLISFFMGLTKLDIQSWIFICLFARIPSIVTSTLGGSAIGNENYVFAAIVFGITLLISIVGLIFYRKYTNHKSKRVD